MKVKINKKDFEINVGLKFIRELDKKYTHKFGNVEFGLGINKSFLMLSQYNPTILVDLIEAGTSTDANGPTIGEIETYVESLKAEEIVKLCESFMDCLSESSMTMGIVAQIGLMSQMLEN